MTDFPLTRKKLMGLTGTSRRKWIIQWLSGQYQSLLTNRTPPEALEEFYVVYARVHQWISLPILPKPGTFDMRTWMAFVSDAVQEHRSALGVVPRDHDLLPAVVTGDRTGPDPQLNPLDYHIALDGLRSLFNVGSIFRTCDAGGFSSILLGNTPGGEHRTVKKTSMGAADWVRHTAAQDLGAALLEKKELGYAIIGIETAENAIPFHRFPWPEKGVIVLGNEEYGISSHVLAICDHLVTIPMAGKKNSINVASAAAVLVFHVGSCLRP